MSVENTLNLSVEGPREINALAQKGVSEELYFSDSANNMSLGKGVTHSALTSSVASEQHQHEQVMLSDFAVPRPPVSIQQSSDLMEKEEGTSSKEEEPRTLWMGDLDPLLDEAAVTDLWWQILEKRVSVKIIKPKLNVSEQYAYGLVRSGYCFVEFETYQDAEEALKLNGRLLPDIAIPSQIKLPNNPDNQKKYFRLNWASSATLSSPVVQSLEYSLFVGDLSASTTEAYLLSFFQKRFPDSVKTVRVMTDPITGKSRCFGFVRFTKEAERQRALREMNGVWFGGRTLRVALASSKVSSARPRTQNNQVYDLFPDQPTSLMMLQGRISYYNSPFNYYEHAHTLDSPNSLTMQHQYPEAYTHDYASRNLNKRDGGINSQTDIPLLKSTLKEIPATGLEVTTVFVGGLSSDVQEGLLYELFNPYGHIQQVKIPAGKNCGFVKYSTRQEAENAISLMQGYVICGNRVRLSWGRATRNHIKGFQAVHRSDSNFRSQNVEHTNSPLNLQLDGFDTYQNAMLIPPKSCMRNM